ncbi:hypothetical protein [Zestomonas thermotolerans]|uniref:hypothetical protein n=1 Tax=Zestomonas thermotolerans TaxID=157784 RepID=UPI0012DEFBCE|nr:hypothetical protein [Pseudomonas thermotolerans]
MHELTTVTSASLGDGRIHSSWTGGVVQLEIDGDGTSIQHKLSAKLRSDPGNSRCS